MSACPLTGSADECRCCQHESSWFSREICPCGQMHYYCEACGALTDHCCSVRNE